MKTGLVLEGGAMRGMFTAGVLDVLMEHGITVDGAIGVSAGAVFGCNYKSHQIGRTIRYNTEYCTDKRYASFGNLLRTGNLYSEQFCYHTVPEKLDPFDTEAFRENPMDFFVVCTDVRTGEPAQKLIDALEHMKSAGINCRMLFLEADTQSIINRYKETRRSHPLAGDGVSVAEALQKERILLQPVRDHADYVLDTSGFSTTKLHAEILNLFSDATLEDGMHVNVLSFGFKNGIPVEADLVMDVRFMPNPYYIEDLKRKTGLDDAVRDYVFSFSQTNDFMKRMEDLLSFLLPLYSEEGKTILVIGIGCTGGHHRSVAVAHALSEYIQSIGYPVTEIHRDITR